MRKIVFILLIALGAGVAVWLWRWEQKEEPTVMNESPAALKTIQDRLEEFGTPVRARLAPYFQQAGVSYPPSRIAMVAIKQTRKLELWAAKRAKRCASSQKYAVLAASGQLGPKLREGDRRSAGRGFRVSSF